MATTRWVTESISVTELPDGRYHVTNNGEHITMPGLDLIPYLSKHVTSQEHIPLGDYLHKLLKGFGFSSCLPCVERQAKLNRVIRRPSR